MMEEVDLADTPLAMRPQLQAQDSDPPEDEEPPDPRIQVELERLNTSTDLINKLEVDLDEARMRFRQTLLESTQQIDRLTKKLGKCVEQARPYYDARIKAKQALTEAQKSAVRYERAVSQHAAAREMVQLAEEGLLARGCIFDSTWQEMLNHATTKVNDAEREKIESTTEHKEKSNKYHNSETQVKFLQKELKRAIAKSSLNARRSLMQLSNIIRMQDLQLLPYFELKAAVNQRLEEQKRYVRELEVAVASAKTNYSQALTNLETISDQIHKTRKIEVSLGTRGVGVGAESPGPPLCGPKETAIAREKSLSVNTANGASLKDENDSDHSTTMSQDKQVMSSCQDKNGHIQMDTKHSGLMLASSYPASSKDDTKVLEVEQRVTMQSQPTAQVEEASSKESLSRSQLNNFEETGGSSEATQVVTDAEAPSSYLSSWQFVALPTLNPTSSQSHLSADDRESILSDSESLISSIEMLSEEAIANLMLEDEINEATQSICSPHLTEEYLAPPSTKTKDLTGSQVAVPEPATSNEEEGSKEDKKEIKNDSQASSSDSAELWEVVSNTQEVSSEAPNNRKTNCSDPSVPAVKGGEDLPVHSTQETKSTPSNVKFFLSEGDTTVDSPVGLPVPVVSVKTSYESMDTTDHCTSKETGDRPQSLGVVVSYPKGSTSSFSSSSTSNSLSEEFSPCYAPLSDTPEWEQEIQTANSDQ